jgi:hypothetical protein
VDYRDVKYDVEGFERPDGSRPLLVHLKSAYIFNLKLSVFLAGALGVSVNKIKDMAHAGLISASPACDGMKCKIKSDMDIYILRLISTASMSEIPP